jgi:DNA-binding cell septation regulator SpoVG
MKFKLTDWTPKRTGSLYGFASVVLDDYLKVEKIAIRDGKRGLWAALPSSSWTDRAGKAHYDIIVSFAERDAANRFSDALVSKLRERHPTDFAS